MIDDHYDQMKVTIFPLYSIRFFISVICRLDYVFVPIYQKVGNRILVEYFLRFYVNNILLESISAIQIVLLNENVNKI